MPYQGERNEQGKRHGQGTMTRVDGTEYEGEWQEGKRHGRGTMTRADGDVYYEGQWQEGKRHNGRGTMRGEDGTAVEGVWEEGAFRPSGADELGEPDPPNGNAPAPAPPRDMAPEDASSPSGGGSEESNDGVRVGGKRSLLRERRELEAQQVKWARKEGAILAPSRTGEGYQLPTGQQLSCKPDAAFNGIRVLAPEFKASLNRLRKIAIPELGSPEERQASWGSLATALQALGYPFELVEATARFKSAGGPMLNLLKAPPAVFLVSLCVTAGGKQNKHCVMLSTVPQKHAAPPHAPFGKMIDNHGKMLPVYIQKKDLLGKKAARDAFLLFIGQNPAVHGTEFTVTPAAIYELKKKDTPTQGS